MKKYFFLTVSFLGLILVTGAQQPTCTPFPKTISISGSAEMSVVPDEIYVQVTLREYQKKGQAKVDLETIKAGFLSACRKVNIADTVVQLASYDGSDNYWNSRKKRRSGELFTSIVYEIKFSNSTDMDNLVEKLNDDATEKFEIVRTSHSKIIEYRKQLKIDAVKAAKAKAIYLAESINEKIGEAITIMEPQEDGYYAYLRPNIYSNSSSNSSMNVSREEPSSGKSTDFKKLKLRYSVDVLFALK